MRTVDEMNQAVDECSCGPETFGLDLPEQPNTECWIERKWRRPICGVLCVGIVHSRPKRWFVSVPHWPVARYITRQRSSIAWGEDMSEIEALLGLYGAVDRAIVAGEADSASLAPFLSAYRDGAAEGWYDGQYLPWVDSVRERDLVRANDNHPPGLPDIPVVESDIAEAVPVEVVPPEAAPVELSERAQEVHDALVAFSDEPVEGRVAARRLLAVTVAAHAFPQHFGSRGSHAAVGRSPLVLKRTDVDPDGYAADPLAAQLHVRLEDEFTSMSQWSQVVGKAVDDGVLPVTFRSQALAPPCTGSLILRPGPNGDPDPCTVLEAEFTTDQLRFEDARNYLEPANWQFPGSLWCRMQKDTSLGKNSWLYHETVATSCPPTPGGWSVSTDLQFWFSHPTPSEARAEYDLAPGLPDALSDIEIDEGSLRVIELPDGRVNVKTTKRVRFAGSFDGAGLAMFMCASGYSTVLEDMVFSVASRPVGNAQAFSVQAPPGGAMNDPKIAKKAAASTTQPAPQYSTTTTPPGGGADSLDAIADDTAAFVGSYLKDVTATYSASVASIQAGTYKVEDVWADGIKLWSSYMSGLGKAFELGTRTAKVYQPKPTDES